MFRISSYKQWHRQKLAPFMRSNVLCSIENRFVGYSIHVFIIPISQGHNIEDNRTNILFLSYQNKITYAVVVFQIRHILCARPLGKKIIILSNSTYASSLIFFFENF